MNRFTETFLDVLFFGFTLSVVGISLVGLVLEADWPIYAIVLGVAALFVAIWKALKSMGG